VSEGALTVRFKQWQQQVITSLMAELSGVARQARPQLAISSAVMSDLNRAREEKAQDWKAWLDAHYLDYVCTMTYTPDRSEFEALIRKQQIWAGGSQRVVVGIGSWKFGEMNQLWSQIDTARRLGNYGFALFSYDDAEARNFLPALIARN
jgi:uncharacterized lipoprotein YddW (UPF0748 family)